MKVHVEYVAQMKAGAGVDAETLDVPAPVTAKSFIAAVTERHGDKLQTMLLDDAGNLRSSVLVFVGDAQVEWDSAEPIGEGSKVTLLAPLAGG